MNVLQLFRVISLLVSEDQVNAELALAENCLEIDPGAPVEDHGDPCIDDEQAAINELFEACEEQGPSC